MYVLLGLALIVFIIGIVGIVLAFQDSFEEGWFYTILILILVGVCDMFLLNPVLIIDKKSGSTIGTITSVDKNFFGSTAIYIKTSETEQEQYCAEDENIIEVAKENIGNKVKISYGTRVGIYPLSKCDQAPISKIEIK